VTEQIGPAEVVLREYPSVTYWLKGRQALGAGNLILTTRRLIFLNRVALADWQLDRIRELSEAGFDQLADFVLKLHKNNFQIPLERVSSIRLGLFSMFPFPRLCMRVHYRGPRKRSVPMETGFWFRIPILKGLVQLEITLVLRWIRAVKQAARARQGSG
jgi:hypothetical protein